MALDRETSSVPGSETGPRRIGRPFPKGRVLDDRAAAEVAALLGAAPRRRDLLIEHLHLLQDRFGHLSMPHLQALAGEMRLSMAEVYEVASFYAHFDLVPDGATPPPPLTVRVCDGLSCALAGAEDLRADLEAAFDPAHVRILRAPCIGRCAEAPAAALSHRPIDRATTARVADAVARGATQPDLPDYQELDAYVAAGGYARLRALRTEGDPAAVEADLLTSGLRGLGGAGFPAGRKWAAVRSHPAPRHLAVNGDEGEPGTFKDRHHLERAPHEMLEGMLIAAWAVAAQTCYIYMRDEYPAVLEILRREIAALEQAGLVPAGHIVLRRGAGAYICGEESAMLESIEGKRGLPRHRPPYVAEAGLWGRPTLVHNVETLVWVMRVCRDGPDCLVGVEKNGRRGLRSYSVSGRVARPGVYELPAGSTIRDVIAAAGGMAPGHRFAAYQPGGPSSGLLPATLDDVPLDFDTLNAHGTFIGSAAVVVLGHGDRARDVALGMLRFFEDESCGQCTPCRAGCAKAVQLMQAERWDRDLLEALCETMADASICGLGQAAPNPIRSVLRFFPEEV